MFSPDIQQALIGEQPYSSFLERFLSFRLSKSRSSIGSTHTRRLIGATWLKSEEIQEIQIILQADPCENFRCCHLDIHGERGNPRQEWRQLCHPVFIKAHSCLDFRIPLMTSFKEDLWSYKLGGGVRHSLPQALHLAWQVCRPRGLFVFDVTL